MSESFSKLDGEKWICCTNHMYILNCGRCCKTDLQSSCKNFNSHQQCREIVVSAYPHQYLMLVKVLYIYAILCVNMVYDYFIILEAFIDNVGYFVYCFIFRFQVTYKILTCMISEV